MQRMWRLVYGYKDKTTMINDPIEEFFDELLELVYNEGGLTREDIEALLEANDLMIAPVGDPTNLFGVMEDSL